MSVLPLPPELLHRIISFLDTEDIPSLLLAFPPRSDALRLFQLVKNHPHRPFLFKNDDLRPIQLKDFCAKRHRALVTLVELDPSVARLDVRLIQSKLSHVTGFIAITSAEEDGDWDGGNKTQLLIKSLRRCKFLIMSCPIMSLVLRDVGDASRIHIRDTGILALHTSNRPELPVSWSNITSLDLNVNCAEYLDSMDLSQEPRERLQVTKARGATSRLVMQNFAIRAEYIIQFVSCYHLESITFENARYAILLYPIFGKEKQAPVIKNIEAPQLEVLYLYSDDEMLPDIDGFHAPKLRQIVYNGHQYDLMSGGGALCPLYEMVVGDGRHGNNLSGIET